MLSVIALLFFPSILSSSNEDRIFTGIEVCNAYAGFENQFKCGQDGYFIGYGNRYCRRFFDKEYYSHFDHGGKQFVQCTGKCLVDDLRSFLRSNPKVGCSAITNKAFASHVDCYVKCGFCNACKTNKEALLHIYEFKDFLSIKSLQTVEKTLKKCGGIVKGGLSCLTG